MATISRRAFLKTVGVGALSVAAMSVLSGCEGMTQTNPIISPDVVDAEYGVTYKVSDLLSVSAEKPSVRTNWLEAYVDAYKEYLEDHDSEGYLDSKLTAANYVKAYKELSSSQKTTVKSEATREANREDADGATIKFQIGNYSSNHFLFAESGSASDGYKSVAFSATADGVSVPCTTSVNVANAGSFTTVTCNVELPGNTDEYEITVALPYADKTLKYTFSNTAYLGDLDPTTTDFYKVTG